MSHTTPTFRSPVQTASENLDNGIGHLADTGKTKMAIYAMTAVAAIVQNVAVRPADLIGATKLARDEVDVVR